MTGPRAGLQSQLDIARKPVINITLERKSFERMGELVRYLLWFSEEESMPLLHLFIKDYDSDENLEILKQFLVAREI